MPRKTIRKSYQQKYYIFYFINDRYRNLGTISKEELNSLTGLNVIYLPISIQSSLTGRLMDQEKF